MQNGDADAARRDFLLRAATPFFVIGSFATPMLVFRVAGFTLGDAGFLIGALLVVLAVAPSRPPQPAMQLAIVLGALGGALVLTTAVDPGESASVLLRVLYVWTIWQVGVRKWAATGGDITLLAGAFVLGAAVSGVVAIGQAAGFLIIPGTEIVFGRVPGLTGHVNGQGGVMAVAITLAVGLMLAKKRPLLNGGALAFCAVGVLLAGSVTGMMGAASGIIAVFIALRVRLSRILLLAAALVAGITLALNIQSIIPGASSPLERLADTTGQGSGESTLALRLRTDAWAWGKIQESPIVGFGLDPASGVTYDGLTATHNMLLLVWFQGGLLFLIAILTVLVYTVVVLRRAERSGAWAAVVGACVAAFVFSMTGPVLYERWFWFPLVLAWSLPMALNRRTSSHSHQDASQRAPQPTTPLHRSRA